MMIKKRSKVLISFLFALIFVFQLAVPMASAAPADGVDVGQAKLEYRLSVLKYDDTDPEAEPVVTAVTDENKTELLGEEKDLVLSLGEDLYDPAAAPEFKSILKAGENPGKDLIFTVPEGFFVKELYIHGASIPVNEKNKVDLLPFALAAADSADLRLSSLALSLEDESGSYINSTRISGGAAENESSFIIEILLDKVPAAEDVVIVDARDESNPAVITDGKVPADVEASEPYTQAMGWRLEYENKSSVIVDAGSEISPYASCKLIPNIVPVYYEITVSVKSDLKVETGVNVPVDYYSVEGLPEGMSISGDFARSVTDAEGNEISGNLENAGSYNITMTQGEAKLLNSAGEEVPAENYGFVFNPGTVLAEDAGPISVVIKVNAPVEDGDGFKENGYTYVSGLRDGDKLGEVNFIYEIVYKGEGADRKAYCVIKPESTAKFLKGDDSEITGGKYVLDFQKSDSAAAPLLPPPPVKTPIELQVNFSDVYNGAPHTIDLSHISLSSGSLAAGHKIVSFQLETVPDLTNAVENGVLKIKPGSVVIKDNDGSGSVVDSYEISYRDGSLNIKKQPLSISAYTGTKKQDSEGQTIDAAALTEGDFTKGYKIEGLLAGHKAEGIAVEGAGNAPGNVSTSVNTSALLIKDADSNDVTANYAVSTNTGVLTIEAPEAAAPQRGALTIKPKDISADYNGQEQKPSEYELAGSLAEGDSIEITYKGSSVDVCTNLETSIDTLVIKDSEGNDVTSEYTITKNPGYITIKPLSLTLTGISGPVQLDEKGSTIYANTIGTQSGAFRKGLKVEGLLAGHDIPDDVRKAMVSGSSNTPGSFSSVVDKTKLKVTDSSNKDVTANYTVASVTNGTVTVKAAVKPTEKNIPLTVTAKDAKWTYDGKAHKCEEYSVSGLKDGDKVKSVVFDSSSTITNAGSVPNKITSIVIVDKDGKAIPASKYSESYKSGTLTVEKYNLTVTAESASKSYDGKPLVNKNVSIGKLANPDHKISVVYTIYNSSGKALQNSPIDAGTYTKKITKLSITDGNKQDVTDNYNIKKVDGTLTIKNSDKNNTDGPKTGDESRLGIWIGILAGSAVLIAAVVIIVVIKNKKSSGGSEAPAEEDNEFEVNIDDSGDSEDSDKE